MTVRAIFLILVGLLGMLGSVTFADASTYVVDRLTDGNPAGGEGSGLAGDLRYAINNAQSGDDIAFVVTGTITLAAGLPALTRDISVQGPGANRLTVRGAGGSVLAVSTNATVVLAGLTVTGGGGAGVNGGGIFNRGTLTLNQVAISGNSVGCGNCGLGTGGGIWNYANAVLRINHSTISGNSALGTSFYGPARGGGLANDGLLMLNNSTISSNISTWGSGGGVHNFGIVTVSNCTISGNSASGGAAGIANSGTLSARSTIVARNQNGDLIGSFTSLGHNLFGSTNGASGFRPDLGDLLNVDPLLGPLSDNGGPTRTMALRVGSLAIDQGADSGMTADQRGEPRPYDDPNVSNASSGDGSDIGAYECSALRIVSLERIGNDLEFRFSTLLGLHYFIESRTDLDSGSWTAVTGSIDGNGGIVSATQTNVFGQMRQFYRIKAQP